MSNAISNIILCDVPITPTNQIDFENITAQRQYFVSKAVNSVNTVDKNFNYQPRTGTINIKGYVDAFASCNYGYYVNTYNGITKTFYFWIVARDFSSRNTTTLTIQIDVFQSWLFDFNFTPCFIEREHTTDDILGHNTLQENFELGDYVTLYKKPVSALMGDPCYLVGVTDGDSINGSIFGKIYTGFELRYYNSNGVAELNSYIQSLATAGKADAIAFIFTFPDNYLNSGLSSPYSNGEVIPSFTGYKSATESFNWNEIVHNFLFNGQTYTPYNNKLYCYPFNFITVKNSSGGNVVLKFEMFSNINAINFSVDSTVTQNPHVTLTPQNYGGKLFAIDDSITMQDFGLCSWNNDNYSNWYAQHANSINAQSVNAVSSFNAKQNVNGNNFMNALDIRDTNAIKGASGTAIGVVGALGRGNILGGTAQGVNGAINTYMDYQQAGANAQNDLSNSSLLNVTDYQNTIRSIMGSVKDASVQPNTCKGSTATSGLDLARDTATFFIEQIGIKPEFVRKIDMYFQMFGYQVNQVKLPQLHTRGRWNYLKTTNCQTFGQVPHADLDELNRLFNTGITVWHAEDYMYNYDIQNNILT